MRDNVKVPAIASTITPPRHVMASVERGKLGRGERVALAGLACYDRTFLGRPIMAGDWQAEAARNRRDRFSGEQAAASPVNPYNVDTTATADRATTGDGVSRPVITHDGRVKVCRTLDDGDDMINFGLATGQTAAVETRPADVTAPMRDVVAAPVKIKTEVDLVPGLLASMGHTGEITPRLRALALDVLAKRAQDVAYIGH